MQITIDITELTALVPSLNTVSDETEVFWELLADLGCLTNIETTTIVTRGVLLDWLEVQAPYNAAYDTIESFVKSVVVAVRGVPAHHYIAIDNVDKTEEN